jgi:hypothetical protein
MPGHQPIPRPVDLTDLPNPMHANQPMDQDQRPVATLPAARALTVVALYQVQRDRYEEAARVLRGLSREQLGRVVECAAILGDLAASAQLAAVGATQAVPVAEPARVLTAAEVAPTVRFVMAQGTVYREGRHRGEPGWWRVSVPPGARPGKRPTMRGWYPDGRLPEHVDITAAEADRVAQESLDRWAELSRQPSQIAAEASTLTEPTVPGVSAVLALQEDADGASAAEVPHAD